MFPVNPTEGQIYKNKMWSAISGAWVDGIIVVESGSNANGSYRKFSDGTMECWRTIPVNINGSYLFFDWTFPRAFISNPVVTVSLNAGGSGVWLIHGSSLVSPSTFHQVFYKANQGEYADPNYLHCHAIGRWRT